MKIGDHRLAFHKPGNPINREEQQTGVLRSAVDRAAVYMPFKFVRQRESQDRHQNPHASFIHARHHENWRNGDDGGSIFSAEDPFLSARRIADLPSTDGDADRSGHQELASAGAIDEWDRQESEIGSGDLGVDDSAPMENTFDPTLEELSALAAHWKTDDLASVHAVLCALDESLQDIPTDASKIYLSRNTQLKYCNMDDVTISNNPKPVARVYEHPSHGGPPLLPGGGVDYSFTNQRKIRIPGINFLISIEPFIENDYDRQHKDSQSISVTLEDALKRGRVLKDATAVVGHAVLVDAREPIPFELVL